VGAVQKLATVVIVGLVALATLLVVFLANEGNRRDAEAQEQEDVAVERAVDTYVTNCVVCHGPAGEGLSAPDAPGTSRIGYPLGGQTDLGKKQQDLNQTDDPVKWDERKQVLWMALQYGRNKVMPAWGRGGGGQLNDEQIDELVTMIHVVDWDRVYNAAVEADGGYPTPGPAPVTAKSGASAAAPTPAAGAPSGGGAAAAPITIAAADIKFEPTKAEIPANTDVLVKLPNNGALPHNFSIDALNISVDLPAGEQDATTTINAAPGSYEYYCNIPGHKDAGMVGTLTVKLGAAGGAAASPAASTGSPAAGAASPAAGRAPPPNGGQPAAAPPVTIKAADIKFEPKEAQIAASTDVTVMLPNEGALPHNFSIDELDISVDLPAGEKDAKTTINAPAGTYEYYCDIPGHKEAGMVGTLTVK
jgi:uncharacterized cupredoxin-like copper-binding protein/mono/diheme cytochrome c family protein